MSVGKLPRTVVWAVDPYTDSEGRQSGAIEAMNLFCANRPKIQPVYVWSGGIPEGIESEYASVLERMRVSGGERLRQWAAPRLGGTLLPLEVLVRPLASTTDSARAVLDFAHRAEADLIALSRNLHQGLDRILLGSFAESLSLISDVPVLMAPTVQGVAPRARRVLFPTDFSDASFAALEEVYELAAACRWGVTLYHKVEAPVYPGVEFAWVAAADIEADYRDEVHNAREQLRDLARSARIEGLDVDIIADINRTDRVGHAIVRRLGTEYALIALASHSGRVARTFMGSTSRYLIRHAALPVWVLRPRLVRSARHRFRVRSHPAERRADPRA